jgi:hypothetical protein
MNNPQTMVTAAGRKLMHDLQFKGQSFAPLEFVMAMRMAFPQFDEKDEQGRHKQ